MLYKSRSFSVLFLFLCTSFLSANAVVSLGKKMLNTFNLAAYIGVQRYTQPITRHLMVSEAKLALRSLPSLVEDRRMKPTVVTALWTGGSSLIFASSAKGKGSVPGLAAGDELQIPTPVQDALRKCADEFEGKHNYQGKCGEIMVIAEWIKENPGKPLPREKLIVTVDSNGVKPPCAPNEDAGTYGCEQFLEAMTFDKSEIIDKDPDDGEACEPTAGGSLGKRTCKKGQASKAVPKKEQAKPQPQRAKSVPKPAARPGNTKTRPRRSVRRRRIGRRAL